MFLVSHNDGSFNDSLNDGFSLGEVLSQKHVLVEELLSLNELSLTELSLSELSLSLQEGSSLEAVGGGGGSEALTSVATEGLVESNLSHG